jgi:hypothetical protein
MQRQQEGLTKVRVQKPQMPRTNLDNAEATRRTLSICRGIKMKTKELKSELKLRHTLLQRHKKDSNKVKVWSYIAENIPCSLTRKKNNHTVTILARKPWSLHKVYLKEKTGTSTCRGSYHAYSGITLRHRAYKNTYALHDEGHVGRS